MCSYYKKLGIVILGKLKISCRKKNKLATYWKLYLYPLGPKMIQIYSCDEIRL